MPRSLSFEYVLTPQGIEPGRRLLVDDSGVITAIEHAPDGPFDGYLALPGMPNAHSHSFQRVLRGFGERQSMVGSFRSWRETMYRFANHITPDDLYAISRLAFAEMLRGGFTMVAEFHYLHHGIDGQRGAEMAEALIRAAASTGIRLLLLPVFYQHGGIDSKGRYLDPEAGQKRFIFDTIEDYLRLLECFRDIACGVAPHSIRAVSPAALPELVNGARGILGDKCPIHIHIAEQASEVRDSLLAHQNTPINVLMNHVELDPTWNLVHATHASETELQRVAKAGANVVLCPLTEAYLGDGIFPAGDFLEQGGRIAIGTDSNVRIDSVEELRLLEYGQRLVSHKRPILAGPEGLGMRLWREAASVGARASGINTGLVERGQMADLVVLPETEPIAALADKTHYLDALITGGSARRISDVYVAGRRLISNGAFAGVGALRREFTNVLIRLADEV